MGLWTRVLCSMALASVIVPGTGPAVAQSGGSQVKTYELPKVEPTPASTGAPSKILGVKALRPRPAAMADEKLEQAMQTLNQIIETTEEDDPERPEYLTRLAELYWDKAENFFNKAYGDAMFQRMTQAKARGDGAAVAALTAEQQDLLKQRAYWQGQAVKTYRNLVDRYPTYKNLDSVLYYLGYTLTQMDKPAEGFPFFSRLVRERQDSRYAPDAWLNIGEFHFNSGRMDDAQKAYSEAEKFPQSPAYGLAVYKKGWCLYNLGLFENSMNQFLKVIEYARTPAAQKIGYARQLITEAQRDLVMAYSRVGNPDNAIRVFRQISPTNYMDLAGSLAEGYTAQGEYDKSTRLLRKIMAEYRDGPQAHRAIESQRGIFENAYRMGVKARVKEEEGRLVGLIERLRPTAPKAWIDEEDPRVEELLRVVSTTYHRESGVTRDEATAALASQMYADYLRLFPSAAERPSILINQAILFDQAGRFTEAAEMFGQVADAQPGTDVGREAARSAVASYYKSVDMTRSGGQRDETADTAPRPLSDTDRKLLAASDRYLKMAKPGDPDVVEARFVAALVHYDTNRFREALDGFARIIADSPGHGNAPDAARLMLSCYHLLRDIQGLNAAAERVAAEPRLMQGEVPGIVKGIREQADFNRCFEVEKAERYTAAAECFMAYVKKFPTTHLKERAFLNAGNDFFKARQVDRALAVNTAIFEDMRESPLAARALFNTAEIHRRLAGYPKAAAAYETFVREYPKDELAEEALRFAILFRSGLNEHDAAIANLRRYLELFPKSQHAPSLFLEIGMILHKQGKHPAAQKQFETYVSRFGRGGGDDLYLKALLKIGQSLKAQKNKNKAAIKAFQRVIAEYGALGDADKARVTSAGLAACAEALFLEGESVLDELRAVKLRLPEKVLAKQIDKKLTTLKQAVQIFSNVEEFKQPGWTIAAASRKGLGFQDLATAIERVPPPNSLNDEQKEFFRQGLLEKAQPVWDRAKGEFSRAVETARELKWYNRYSVEAEEALMALDPSFRALPDLRSDPEFFTLNQGRPPLMPEKEGMDAPRWREDGVVARLVAAAGAVGASAEVVYNGAAALEVKGDLVGARKGYDRALAMNPKLANAKAGMARLALREGRGDEAQRLFDAAMQLDPANAGAHNHLAAQMITKGQYREAMEHARMALVADPDNQDAYLILAVGDLNLGLYDVGVLVGRSALALDDRDAAIQGVLGMIFLQKGEVRQAVQLFEKAIVDAPESFDARMNLGLVTLSYKDFVTSTEQFRKAAALRPRDVPSRMALAVALRGMGKGDEALALQDEVLRLDPANVDVRYNRCILFQETLSKNDAALTECDAFLKAAPADHPKRKEAERRLEGIQATIEALKEG